MPHESFWVAIATITPVVALGYLVVITIAVRVVAALLRTSIDTRNDVPLGHPHAVWAPGVLVRGVVFSVVLVAATVGIIRTLVPLDDALNSLANGYDTARPRTVIGDTFEGLIILLGFTAATTLGEIIQKSSQGQEFLRKVRVIGPDPSIEHQD
jgi:hypothetical protein